MWFKSSRATCRRALHHQFQTASQHPPPLKAVHRIILIVTIIVAICLVQLIAMSSLWRGRNDPIPTVIVASMPRPANLHAAEWVDASGQLRTATIDMASLIDPHNATALLNHNCLLERVHSAYADNHTSVCVKFQSIMMMTPFTSIHTDHQAGLIQTAQRSAAARC